MRVINNIYYESPYANDNDEIKQREIALWRAVINQCLADLYLPTSNRKYKVWREQAIEWFLKADEDFQTVCDYARVSPEEIQKYAMKIIFKE